MGRQIQKGANQKKPFRTLELEAFVKLQRTADALWKGVGEALTLTGLSATQYNILRILRGAGPDGLPCGKIAERTVNQHPDITRLLDRLEAGNLVIRTHNHHKDRRIITTQITQQGLRILADLDQPINDVLQRQLGTIGTKRLRLLIDLLDFASDKKGR